MKYHGSFIKRRLKYFFPNFRHVKSILILFFFQIGCNFRQFCLIWYFFLTPFKLLTMMNSDGHVLLCSIFYFLIFFIFLISFQSF